MKLRDISVKWKFAGPIIFSIALAVAVSTVAIGRKAASIVFDEVERSTLSG